MRSNLYQALFTVGIQKGFFKNGSDKKYFTTRNEIKPIRVTKSGSFFLREY